MSAEIGEMDFKLDEKIALLHRLYPESPPFGNSTRIEASQVFRAGRFVWECGQNFSDLTPDQQRALLSIRRLVVY